MGETVLKFKMLKSTLNMNKYMKNLGHTSNYGLKKIQPVFKITYKYYT